MNAPIHNITVIGAGTMGHGIAQVAALAGHTVTLNDMAADVLDRALQKVKANLDGGIKRGKLTETDRDGALARLHCSSDLPQAVAEADLVIEAIVENLGIKESLFAQLGERTPPHTILASNTSSLPISRLAAASGRPTQVLGMHFFNPVHIMKLVEVVVHEGCADGSRQAVLDLSCAMGKDPIVVQDSPGFASSRLGIVLGLEAMRMLEQGVASAEDIDKAMTLGYAHPMGPLKLTDLVGLDVRLAIADYLHGEFKSAQYQAPDILRSKVEKGELGKKSGQGFYSWTD